MSGKEFSARLSVDVRPNRRDRYRRWMQALIPLFALAYLGEFLRGLSIVPFIGAYAVAMVYFLRRPRARRIARVHATENGIFVDGEERVAKRDIASGYLYPGTSTSVRLQDRAGREVLDATVEDEAQGRALLESAGVDPTHKRVEFRGDAFLSPLASSGRPLTLSVFAASVVALLAFGKYDALAIPFGVFAVANVLLGSIPSKVIVGNDGIFHTWLRWKRFFPAGKIRNASAFGPSTIRLELEDGSFGVISLVHRGMRDAVLARIQDVLALRDAAVEAKTLVPLIARGERSIDDWLDALRSLKGGSAYRDLALQDEALVRIVESASESEDARAGAAFLLREGTDVGRKERVRVAAEATASPKLRVALDAAAEDDEAALAAAMSSFETR